MVETRNFPYSYTKSPHTGRVKRRAAILRNAFGLARVALLDVAVSSKRGCRIQGCSPRPIVALPLGDGDSSFRSRPRRSIAAILAKAVFLRPPLRRRRSIPRAWSPLESGACNRGHGGNEETGDPRGKAGPRLRRSCRSIPTADRLNQWAAMAMLSVPRMPRIIRHNGRRGRSPKCASDGSARTLRDCQKLRGVTRRIVGPLATVAFRATPGTAK